MDFADQSDAAPAIRTAAVVVNHNGGERVLGCVAALHRLRTRLDQIIVVDNASTDDSPTAIKEQFPGVQLLALPSNEGPPRARNIGLRAVHTRLVLLIDNDVYLDDDALDHMIAAQVETGAAVVVPRVVLHPERCIVQCDGAGAHFVGTLHLRHGYQPLTETPVGRAGVGACISACMLVDRIRLLDAGGFDELFFFYFEDLEVSLRLRSLGHDLVCESSAVAYHDRGAGIPYLSFRGRGSYPARRAYLSHRNRWFCMLVHYRLRTLLVMAPLLAIYELASAAFFVVNGSPRGWPQAWCWLLGHRREIAMRRTFMQAHRQRGDRELLEGGNLPLAPGLVQRPTARRLLRAFSRLADQYFVVCRRLLQ